MAAAAPSVGGGLGASPTQQKPRPRLGGMQQLYAGDGGGRAAAAGGGGGGDSTVSGRGAGLRTLYPVGATSVSGTSAYSVTVATLSRGGEDHNNRKGSGNMISNNTEGGSRRSLSRVFAVCPSCLDVNTRKLSVVGRYITQLDALPPLKAELVQKLYLSNNNLTELHGLRQFENVQTISLGNNLVRYTEDLAPLADLKHLRVLSLDGNPVADMPHYREHVLALVPTMQNLDGRAVTTAERVQMSAVLAKEEAMQAKVLENEVSLVFLQHAAILLACHSELWHLVFGKFRVSRGPHIPPAFPGIRTLNEMLCSPDLEARFHDDEHLGDILSRFGQDRLAFSFAQQVRKKRSTNTSKEVDKGLIWDAVFADCLKKQQVDIAAKLEQCQRARESRGPAEPGAVPDFSRGKTATPPPFAPSRLGYSRSPSPSGRHANSRTHTSMWTRSRSRSRSPSPSQARSRSQSPSRPSSPNQLTSFSRTGRRRSRSKSPSGRGASPGRSASPSYDRTASAAWSRPRPLDNEWGSRSQNHTHQTAALGHGQGQQPHGGGGRPRLRGHSHSHDPSQLDHAQEEQYDPEEDRRSRSRARSRVGASHRLGPGPSRSPSPAPRPMPRPLATDRSSSPGPGPGPGPGPEQRHPMSQNRGHGQPYPQPRARSPEEHSVHDAQGAGGPGAGLSPRSRTLAARTSEMTAARGRLSGLSPTKPASPRSTHHHQPHYPEQQRPAAQESDLRRFFPAKRGDTPAAATPAPEPGKGAAVRRDADRSHAQERRTALPSVAAVFTALDVRDQMAGATPAGARVVERRLGTSSPRFGLSDGDGGSGLSAEPIQDPQVIEAVKKAAAATLEGAALGSSIHAPMYESVDESRLIIPPAPEVFQRPKNASTMPGMQKLVEMLRHELERRSAQVGALYDTYRELRAAADRTRRIVSKNKTEAEDYLKLLRAEYNLVLSVERKTLAEVTEEFGDFAAPDWSDAEFASDIDDDDSDTEQKAGGAKGGRDGAAGELPLHRILPRYFARGKERRARELLGRCFHEWYVFRAQARKARWLARRAAKHDTAKAWAAWRAAQRLAFMVRTAHTQRDVAKQRSALRSWWQRVALARADKHRMAFSDQHYMRAVHARFIRKWKRYHAEADVRELRRNAPKSRDRVLLKTSIRCWKRYRQVVDQHVAFATSMRRVTLRLTWNDWRMLARTYRADEHFTIGTVARVFGGWKWWANKMRAKRPGGGQRERTRMGLREHGVLGAGAGAAEGAEAGVPSTVEGQEGGAGVVAAAGHGGRRKQEEGDPFRDIRQRLVELDLELAQCRSDLQQKDASVSQISKQVAEIQQECTDTLRAIDDAKEVAVTHIAPVGGTAGEPVPPAVPGTTPSGHGQFVTSLEIMNNKVDASHRVARSAAAGLPPGQRGEAEQTIQQVLDLGEAADTHVQALDAQLMSMQQEIAQGQEFVEEALAAMQIRFTEQDLARQKAEEDQHRMQEALLTAQAEEERLREESNQLDIVLQELEEQVHTLPEPLDHKRKIEMLETCIHDPSVVVDVVAKAEEAAPRSLASHALAVAPSVIANGESRVSRAATASEVAKKHALVSAVEASNTASRIEEDNRESRRVVTQALLHQPAAAEAFQAAAHEEEQIQALEMRASVYRQRDALYSELGVPDGSKSEEIPSSGTVVSTNDSDSTVGLQSSSERDEAGMRTGGANAAVAATAAASAAAATSAIDLLPPPSTSPALQDKPTLSPAYTEHPNPASMGILPTSSADHLYSNNDKGGDGDDLQPAGGAPGTDKVANEIEELERRLLTRLAGAPQTSTLTTTSGTFDSGSDSGTPLSLLSPPLGETSSGSATPVSLE